MFNTLWRVLFTSSRGVLKGGRQIIRVLLLLLSPIVPRFICINWLWKFFLLYKEHDVSIDIEWIPRSENEVADYLSKIVDFDDWCVKDSYFRLLTPLGGPLQLTVLLIPLMLKLPGFIPCFFNLGVWV